MEKFIVGLITGGFVALIIVLGSFLTKLIGRGKQLTLEEIENIFNRMRRFVLILAGISLAIIFITFALMGYIAESLFASILIMGSALFTFSGFLMILFFGWHEAAKKKGTEKQ